VCFFLLWPKGINNTPSLPPPPPPPPLAAARLTTTSPRHRSLARPPPLPFALLFLFATTRRGTRPNRD